MFDISFTELMIIGIVALVVIGPERLPKVARTLGHLLGAPSVTSTMSKPTSNAKWTRAT